MSMGRRRFLTISAASFSGAVLAACNANPERAGKLLAFAERKNEVLERDLFRHTRLDHVPASAGVSGDAFPKYYVSPKVPVWDPAVRGAWSLEISGAVRKPLTLSLEQLVSLPRVAHKVDHFCVEGWNARAEWTGVRMTELAKLVEPTPDAQYVDFVSFDDGYHESWDMDSVTHPQTLIAYGMDGRMLGPGHGAPA
jgi:DMSO/TMAO reductase YedYZ molybdopterin-dependent catalytic subunit